MADRRMFAKSVVGSAKFLRMPSTARLLYYDLGMAADDDGVVEAFVVMRTTGASEDDFSILVAKQFVIILDEENLIVYITDWNSNNYIRNDRYKQSYYATLLYEKTGIASRYTIGIPDGNQAETQVSLVQGSLNQSKKGKTNQGLEKGNGEKEGGLTLCVQQYKKCRESGNKQMQEVWKNNILEINPKFNFGPYDAIDAYKTENPLDSI